MPNSYGRQTTKYNSCPWFNVQGQRENEKRFVFIKHAKLSVKQLLYAKLCGFCQAHKTLCLFQAHKPFLSLLSHDFMQRRKTPYMKIKDGNPSIKSTRHMKARVDTTQRKNENKQSTNFFVSCESLPCCYNLSLLHFELQVLHCYRKPHLLHCNKKLQVSHQHVSR